MIMKGLTPQQLLEITLFVQKHHKFGYVPDEDKYEGHEGWCIKYIDATYDSRQGDYWAISFRGMGKIFFTTNAFNPVFSPQPKDFKFDNLYDWIMAFLKYEWEPKGRTYNFMHGEKEGALHNPFPNGKIEAEWNDFDMIEAFCADLEDRGVQDTIDATLWIIEYRNRKQQKNQPK